MPVKETQNQTVRQPASTAARRPVSRVGTLRHSQSANTRKPQCMAHYPLRSDKEDQGILRKVLNEGVLECRTIDRYRKAVLRTYLGKYLPRYLDPLVRVRL